MSSSTNSTLNKPSQISDGIPFADIAKLLEDLSIKSGPQKTERFKSFIAKAREYFKTIHDGSLDSSKANGDSIYCIIRLLIPNEDRGRSAYNVKGPKLAQMLVEVLALGKDSRDGQALRHYKSPAKAATNTGDLGSLVFSMLTERFSHRHSEGGPTLTKLHNVLDTLASQSNSAAAQKATLQQFFSQSNATALEGKWLVRLLIKNLCHGLKTNAVFDAIHPKASELYRHTSNLQKVCQDLNDPRIEYEVQKVTLFSHCKPMLCTRMTVIEDGFQVDEDSDDEIDEDKSKKVSSKKKQVFLPNPPFIVETKWDGERFHIHYDGIKFKYFSKKGYDFAYNFDETLTPRLKPLIKSGVRSFVLDGEMMAWHKRHKSFTQKGADIDVKKMKTTNPNHCPCFVVFDVLYFNGEIYVDKPTDVRTKVLNEIVVPKEEVLVITEQKLMDCKEKVLEALNDAIDNLEEGLIVKAVDSKYEPGERPITWIKIKPEYIDGTSLDDLDVLILGGYYTESARKRGAISHFLVGVIKKTRAKEEFFPIARVGSGKLRNAQMAALVNDLDPRFTKKPFISVNYRGFKIPDLYLDPKGSTVLQVKASEFLRNSSSVVGYTLRFPRVTKVRDDKPYDQCMSVEEFHRIRESCGGKLVKRSDGKRGFPFRKRKPSLSSSSDDDEPVSKQTISSEAKKDNIAPGPSLVSPSKTLITKPSPIKDAQKVGTNIFHSRVFCVYGQAQWKTNMEASIKQNGGEIVQNPIKEKFCMVGENENHWKVKKAISAGIYDVLKPSWILKCIDSKSEVPTSPADYFSYSEETGKQFEADFDEFGDSYLRPITKDEVRSLVKTVIAKLSRNIKEEEDSDMDVDELKEELISCGGFAIKKTSIFKTFKVAFRDEKDPVLAALIEFYGGEVADSELEYGVTHVIVRDPRSPSKKKHLSAMVVKPQWVEDCISKCTLLDELLYSP